MRNDCGPTYTKEGIMAQITRWEYAKMILAELGVKTTFRHKGALRALVAWMGAEAGWYASSNGISPNGARYNPLNTTLMTGCSVLPTYNVDPGVQNYASAKCGAQAVAATLLHSPDHNYAPIVAALTKRGVTGDQVLKVVAESDWGTFRHPDHSPDYSYATAIWNTYLKYKDKFNAVRMG